jgi:hypothetical protein
MPSLNFQQQFAADVEAGRKRQSIRLNRRFRVGDTVHLFTGMRTKQCRRLGSGIVTEVLPLTISRADAVPALVVSVDCCELSPSAAHALATADGFSGLCAMERWFTSNHGLPFDGWLIRWQPKER